MEGGVDPVQGRRAGVGVAGVENHPPSPLPRLRLLLPLWRLCVEGAMNSLGAKNSAQREDSPSPQAPSCPTASWVGQLLTWLVCSQYCSLLPLRMRGSARR